MRLQKVVCLLCVSFPLCVYVYVCVRVRYMLSPMFSEILSLPSLTCEVEEDDYIPRGQLYLHGDPPGGARMREMRSENLPVTRGGLRERRGRAETA